MRRHRVKDLQFDFAIYPRAELDDRHVARLAQADAAGAKLPPLVICRATRRVVDGFHRGFAKAQRFDDAAEVDCIERDYASDRALFLDAIECNSRHGLTLADADRAKSAAIAEALGIDRQAIAAALSVDPKAIGALSVQGAGKVKPLLTAKPVGRGRAGMSEPLSPQLAKVRALELIDQLVELLPSVPVDERLELVVADLEEEINDIAALA